MQKSNQLSAAAVAALFIAVSPYSSAGVDVPDLYRERLGYTGSGDIRVFENSSRFSIAHKPDTKFSNQANPSEQSKNPSSELITNLHNKSGLTWDQLANLIGVSRRSLHHWAAGEKISSQNLDKLGEFSNLLESFKELPPNEVRLQFLSSSNGTSLYSKLRENTFTGERVTRVPGDVSRRLGSDS